MSPKEASSVAKRTATLATLVALWPTAIVALVALGLAMPALSAGFWEPMELRAMDGRVDAAAGEPLSDSLRRWGQAMTAIRRGATATDVSGVTQSRASGATKEAPGPGRTLVREVTTPTRAQAVRADQADAQLNASAKGTGQLARHMRMPLVGFAVLAAVLTYLLGHLLATRRVGLMASLMLMSVPLWALQTRQLASDLATLCGALLLVCGVVLALRHRASLATVCAGIAAAIIGVWWSLRAGGALLGVVPPVIAAIAYAIGIAKHNDDDAHGDSAAVTDQPRPKPHRRAIVAAIALALVLLATIVITATQTHNTRPPTPGTRQWFGTSFVPTAEISPWLGATWSSVPQTNAHAASAFEHIAFGMWPWSGLALIALLSLAVGVPSSQRGRAAPVMLLAWAGASWLAMALWQLNVGGVAMYSGSAALVLACALWIDASAQSDHQRTMGVVAAIFIGTAIAALAKDAATTRDAFVNLAAVTQLAGKGAPVGYQLPVTGPWGLPYGAWLAAFGILAAIAVLPAFLRRRSRHAPRYVAIAAVVIALGWNWMFYPSADAQLSSQALFATARSERGNDDALFVMSDLGRAPRYYDDAPWRKMSSATELVAQFTKPERAFAIAGRKRDLCNIHRAMKATPYYVLGGGNPQNVLLSNQPGKDGKNHNPLASVMMRDVPAAIANGTAERPASPIIFDNKLELIGWRLPKRIARSKPFAMTLYFRVLAPMGGNWKLFGHYDGPGQARFGSDHAPIDELCGTNVWEAGDYIVDTYRVTSNHGALPVGPYQLWVGLFTGTNPNFRNMSVSSAPAGSADGQQRVKIATVPVY